MDSVLVLPLTVEARDYFRLPEEADGAVGPRGNYAKSHLQDVIHVVQTHGNTSHQPLHGGRGDPVEGTVALQSLLQGTRRIKQPGGGCREAGSRVSKHPDFPSLLPPGPSLLLICDSHGASERLSGSPEGLGLRLAPLHLLSSSASDSASALTSGLSAQNLGEEETAPQTVPVPQPRT